MIDIHCHILPCVDDGPESITASLEMAREAVAHGIHTIIATPHHQNGRFVNNRELVIKSVNEFNQLLQEYSIDITILPGQEVRLFGEMLSDDEEQHLVTLGDSKKYVLVEFPSNHLPRYAERFFFEMQSMGYTPIIAHPERNSEIMEKPDMLYKLIKGGALAQVTAQSVTGTFGKKVQKFSLQLFEHNLAHFVASDAHGKKGRGFALRDAYDVLAEEYGQSYCYLLKENAELVVQGLTVNREIPEEIVPRKKFLGIF